MLNLSEQESGQERVKRIVLDVAIESVNVRR